MKQWFFENIPAFQPEIGFEIRFNVNSGEINFLHVWNITDVIPYKKSLTIGNTLNMQETQM